MLRRFLQLAAVLALTACGNNREPAPPPVATTTPTPATPAPESANPEANKLFMEARAKGLDRSRQGISAAIALLEKAVRLDRSFVRGHAELALAWGTLDDSTDPLVRCPRAKAAARRAIALNGASAPALAARGFAHYRCDWQWTRAESDFAQAIAANPGDAFARHQYGLLLATLGRTEDALRELGRASELEPGDVAIRADLVAPCFGQDGSPMRDRRSMRSRQRCRADHSFINSTRMSSPPKDGWTRAPIAG
jgi:tetratricopeptide (TPR) repeat protein